MSDPRSQPISERLLVMPSSLNDACRTMEEAHTEIAALRAKVDELRVALTCDEIDFEYTNWEGRKGLRRVRPISIRFGKSEWHPKSQWLMLAFDIDKGTEREFAMADMAFEDDALAALAVNSQDGGTGA